MKESSIDENIDVIEDNLHIQWVGLRVFEILTGLSRSAIDKRRKKGTIRSIREDGAVMIDYNHYCKQLERQFLNTK